MKYFTFFLTISFCFNLFSNESCVLLSYPRSGNTWLRYSLECLTKRPSYAFKKANVDKLSDIKLSKINKKMSDPIGNTFPEIHTNHALFPIIKLHKIENDFDLSFPLILLLRNYKECFSRHFHQKLSSTHDKTKVLIEAYEKEKHFFTNLNFFDKYKTNKKLLIHYEDLIENPKKIFQLVLDFLSESNENLNDFMKNYNSHKNRSVQFYIKHSGLSMTRGKDILYHSKKMKLQDRLLLDNFIKKTYPILWEKYLKIYAEE